MYIHDNSGRTLDSRAAEGAALSVVNYLGRPALAARVGTSWRIVGNDWKTLKTLPFADMTSAESHLRTNQDGTKALVTFKRVATVDLTPYGGPQVGKILEGVVREVDLATGTTTFEWSSLSAGPGQVPLADSRVPIAADVDYVGLNAAAYDTDGGILVSASSTGSVYKLDRTTGGFAWILGGERNQFSFIGTDATPHRPIDASREPGTGRLAFLDDNASAPARSVSYTLDETAKTAKLDWHWTSEDAWSDVRTGGNQVLPNGNRLITFGAKGAVAEVTPAGAVVFESQVPAGVAIERAQRAEWSAPGRGLPVIYGSPTAQEGKIAIDATWNGATDLASWQVSAGSDKDHLTPVLTAPATSLQTDIKAAIPPAAVGYTVTALDKNGTPIPGGVSSFRYVDDIIKAVSLLPDPSVMGTPLGLATPVPNGLVREFGTGLGYQGYNYPSYGTFLVHGPLAEAYKALGGPTGPLGAPTGQMVSYPDGGRALPLGNKTLVWSPATGARTLVGSMSNAWRTSAAPATEFGYPTGDAVKDPAGAGCLQAFTIARLYAESCDTGSAYPVSGAIGTRWDSIRQWLGYPVDRAQAVNGSLVQRFQNGAITSSPDGTTKYVFGAIYARWQERGGAAGFLGLPTTDELPVGDGIGRVSQFQGGSIYWSPKTGAGEVHGGIRTRWLQLGGPTGFLGYPFEYERAYEGNAAGGRSSVFQGGELVWSAATGVHEVHGGIGARWRGTTFSGFWLGFPLTDEMPAGSGRGRYQVFQNGAIFWSPQTDATIIRGAIGEKWATQGWDSGWLGFPIRDEFPVTGTNGVVQRFEGGSITWGPSAGAHMMPSWFDHTFFRPNMGLPTTDVLTAPGGQAQYVLYEQGAAYTNYASSSKTYTIAIYGGIWAKYQSMGTHNSCLGLPNTGEYDGTTPGTRSQQFANGTITWSAATGQTVAKCYNGKTY
ncbi:arylsulfotransferase family protein [Yinghuangia soli]|uniref:LGFP repeat-containing protein n=1 Tax=Yinghuangia soli TaxID=2908204 RepID=A0AA41PVZ2_9ACTN|nr:arylsulfotransferase family protein [Yinghuangia soli]MCF2525909.1 hypothetical protein [Yinghuangia soli]